MKNKYAIIALVMRTVLFALIGVLMIILFKLLNYPSPTAIVQKYWFFQVIIANITTFILLKSFLRKDNRTYRSVFGFRKELLKRDIFLSVGLLIPSAILGIGGMLCSAYLIYGNTEIMKVMNHALPIVPAMAALLLFAPSIALTETPTYFGYAYNKFADGGKSWAGLFLCSFFLALQHISIPMIIDWQYMLWRFLSFLPLAVLFGYFYMRTGRLLPLIIVHFLMDIQVTIMAFFSI